MGGELTLGDGPTFVGLAQQLYEQLAGLAEADVEYVAGTGYGRYKVTFGREQVTEISCHARGAVTLFPLTRTVIDSTPDWIFIKDRQYRYRLVNQGYLCVGSSTRGGCRALCTRPGHPCVGCRGPSDAFIEKDSSIWFTSIERVFTTMTDIQADEIEAALRSPQLALFLFQFADYAATGHPPRPKEKVL